MAEVPGLADVSIAVVAGEDEQPTPLQRPMGLTQHREPVLVSDCVDAGLAEKDKVEAGVWKGGKITCIHNLEAHAGKRVRERSIICGE